MKDAVTEQGLSESQARGMAGPGSPQERQSPLPQLKVHD